MEGQGAGMWGRTTESSVEERNRLQCKQIPALRFRGRREKQPPLKGKHKRLVCHSRRSDGACDKMGGGGEVGQAQQREEKVEGLQGV